MIGGGYIGMETAAGLNKNGLDVTIVFPEKHLMERLFTPEIAAFYEKVYTDKGIKLMPGNTAAAFEGNNGQVRISKPPVCRELKTPHAVPVKFLPVGNINGVLGILSQPWCSRCKLLKAGGLAI